MNLKYLLSIIILLLASLSNVKAQKELKYKEVYELVTQTDTILCYEQMKKFQKQDPFHANSYYQLGLIAQAWSKKYDPLTEYPDVKYFIYHTKVYLELAKKYIDDKEIRKNSDYYQGIGLNEEGKLSLENVISEIDKILLENAEYLENLEKIYSNFTKSVEFYNKSVNLFLAINRNTTKEKELLLTADINLNNQISILEKSYDSTLFYLDSYISNIQKYPLKSYNQRYSIKPIETYRLEGLTYSNFLENKIELWDFKKWSQNFNQILATDISDIRQKIDSSYKSLTFYKKTYQDTPIYSDSNNVVTVDPKILFKIGKYDYNSILIDFLKFEESKANLLRFIKQKANNLNDSSDIDLKKKAFYYNKLFEEKEKTDKQLESTQKLISEKSMSKYSDFIKSHFSDKAGFEEYLVKEKQDNEDLFTRSLDTYKQFIYREKLQNQEDTSFTYGKYSISLSINCTEKKLDENESCTQDISTNSKGEKYISGTVNISGKQKAFLCKVSDNKVNWFKTYENKELSKNTGILVKATNDFCFLILSSIEENNCTNKIIQVNHLGKKITEKEISENQIPRFIKYDDINETLLLVFYGNKLEEKSSILSDLILASYDTEMKISSSWEQNPKLNLSGNFVDLIQINEDIYVFANFHEYKNVNLQSMFVPEKSAPNQMNTLLMVINNEGVITKILPYLSNQYYYLTNVIKINNDLINLVGIKGDSDKAERQISNQKGLLHYILINSKGEQIYSN